MTTLASGHVIEETSRIVDSLKTLIHYKKDFPAFSPAILGYIADRGMSAMDCRKLCHPGQGCINYSLIKIIKQLKTALKVAVVL